MVQFKKPKKKRKVRKKLKADDILPLEDVATKDRGSRRYHTCRPKVYLHFVYIHFVYIVPLGSLLKKLFYLYAVEVIQLKVSVFHCTKSLAYL